MRVVTVIQSGGGGVGAGRRTRVIVGRSGPQGPAGGGGGGGATTLDGLTDVALVGTTSGDFLRYSGTEWTDTKITAGDLGTGTADTHHFLAGDLTWQDAVPLDVACKNTTASTIAKGTPVYVTGSVGATTVVEVAPADAASSGTMPAIGLTVTALTANASGYVRVMGVLSDVSTGAYSVNQTLYVASGGGLSNSRPSGSTTLVQNIGKVMRANNNTGAVLVMGPGRSNDVPNLIGTGYLASSGTASASTFLRGDQSWSGVTAGNVSGLGGAATLNVGTTAGTVAAGNDSRFTDSRTPTAHAASHAAAGSDPVSLSSSQVSGLATVATSGSASDLSVGTLAAARLPSLVPVYGTGVDGDVTISSGTTTLAADAYYNNLSISAGATLVTAGYRVYIAGTLSGAGTISNNGGAASGSTAGSAAAGQIFGASGGGGNGGTAGGTQPGAVTNRVGGTGGAGGNGSSGSGGAAQTGGALAAGFGGINLPYDFVAYTQGRVLGTGTGRMLGGNGGSGGGGDGTAGGGGGAGGGLLYVAARTVTFTGSIEAKGGAGASATAGNRGGGGGGGGGVVVLVTASATNTATVTAAGGAGGSGFGTGTAGATGGTGTAIVYTGVK